MHKTGFLILTGLLLLGLWVANGHAAEKVRFGAVKAYPPYDLTILAAQEKGFWKEQGVEVDSALMKGGADVLRAATAGAISVGSMGAAATIQGIARGVPVFIVADYKTKSDFTLYVRADSSYKEPKDLKGAKIGVTALGGSTHVYALVVTKVAGLEKEVRFVGSGGIVESSAALRVKAIDVLSQSGFQMVPLLLAREVRVLALMADYLPKEWADIILFAHKDIIKDRPDALRRVVKAILKSSDFIMTNRSWSVEKLKTTQGVSEEGARLMFEQFHLSRTGKIERKAMENMRNLFIEYEIIPKGTTAPPVEDMFDTRFTD